MSRCSLKRPPAMAPKCLQNASKIPKECYDDVTDNSCAVAGGPASRLFHPCAAGGIHSGRAHRRGWVLEACYVAHGMTSYCNTSSKFLCLNVFVQACVDMKSTPAASLEAFTDPERDPLQAELFEESTPLGFGRG